MFDRVVLLSAMTVAESEDEEIAEFLLLCRDRTEVRGLAEFLAESGPYSEDFGLAFDSLDGAGSSGVLQRNAEFSLELISGGRCSICQGVGCG